MEFNNFLKFLEKYSGIIIITLIILFFLIIASLGINFGQWLVNIVFWFYDNTGDIGIYLGVFLISIFGNFTIIFPVPYLIALIIISVIPGVNPSKILSPLLDWFFCLFRKSVSMVHENRYHFSRLTIYSNHNRALKSLYAH